MSLTAHIVKAELLERAEALAAERLSGDQAAHVTTLLRQYYAQAPPEDVVSWEPADVYGAVLAHYTMARERSAGTPNIRVYNPDVEHDAWQSTHTVIEVVTDDMPFLVDSVSMEVNRRGWGIHAIIHPVVAVSRDADGRLIAVHPPGDAPEDAVAEAFAHVEVDRQSNADIITEVREALGEVLADVRAAVEDWQAMRAQVEDIIEGLHAARLRQDPLEVEEAGRFLQWLHDDHFTFLGYREYDLVVEDGEDVLRTVEGSGLGILRHTPAAVSKSFAKLPPEVRRLARAPNLLTLTKANSRATVHRPAYLDYVGVKEFGDDGVPRRERRFLGLYTSSVYNASVLDIPLVRRKVTSVIERAGFPRNSHNGKALLAILETYPRDALFQVDADELYDISMGILYLQERKQVRLFARKDTYGRFFSCLVFVPRDRYDTATRERLQEILVDTLGGHSVEYTVRLTESVLARVHFIIYTDPHYVPEHDLDEIERRLAEATRSWTDNLFDALVERLGEERGTELHRRYAEAVPASYRDDVTPRAAVADLVRVDELAGSEGLATAVHRDLEAAEEVVRFKLFRCGPPITLSDVLPLLENLGVRVVDERPYELATDGEPLWIYDFGLVLDDAATLEEERARGVFTEAFVRTWLGETENDGFNRLALRAGLAWRAIAVLRAYAKYLRQVGSRFSQRYMEDTLAAHPGIARQLSELFTTRFNPDLDEDARGQAGRLRQGINAALDEVASLDEDRILRAFADLVDATVRTNTFQLDDGEPKAHLSFKLDPRGVPDLPPPTPFAEMFVYSPRVEGVHLRGGEVARGGLRWSDRREDFRTEVLGLMKAQMVKNTVIVPVGAKGGFVAKALPADGDRDAVAAEVKACYQIFIRGLLDVTDNIVGDAIVPPERVVRYDGDDPYLVVAADKGTATFSDVANAISASYSFWLGDAFASGGSVGYDHKAMGITARGAWESVKRHFLELDTDIDAAPFTVVGIGDMSGDVFGNGMLLSRNIKLVGAFNHLHVFIDPDPDPQASHAERQRLFALPRSSWSDYDPDVISAGGGVWPRSAKAIPLSAEAREVLGVDADSLTPNEVIQALLRAPVDLLWNGGIGTYVKASHESHADVGDKTNDAVRVDARELRCRVVGEGGNLGFTQPGRIEYALGGGRINTDAIDNSAGVDCSDHEVNIKILLDRVVADGDLTVKQRNALLEEMTDEVATLVLADNYDQNQALSNAVAHAASMVDVHRRYIRALEQSGRLDRSLEHLPDEEALAERKSADNGLVLPEFAVLLAYTKLLVFDELCDSGLPDDAYLDAELVGYFPAPLRERYAERMAHHRLRREIIANQVTNDLVNRAGITFAYRLGEETGAGIPDLARAYTVARETFGMRAVWADIASLDRTVAAATQTALVLDARRLVERASRWLVRHRPQPLEIAAEIERLRPGPAALLDVLPQVLAGPDRETYEAALERWLDADVPEPIATRAAASTALFSALDLVEVAEATGADLTTAAQVYFRLGDRLGTNLVRDKIVALPRDNRWQTLARDALRDDLYTQQRQLTVGVLAGTDGDRDPDERIAAWMASCGRQVERCRSVLADIQASGTFDLATLSVSLRELRNLTPQDARAG